MGAIRALVAPSIRVGLHSKRLAIRNGCGITPKGPMAHPWALGGVGVGWVGWGGDGGWGWGGWGGGWGGGGGGCPDK